jgi:hypothetical protein
MQVKFEEKRLAHLFPKQWPAYFHSTPRFFPTRWQRSAVGGWSAREWMRNREYQAISATLIGMVAILCWHLWRMADQN